MIDSPLNRNYTNYFYNQYSVINVNVTILNIALLSRPVDYRNYDKIGHKFRFEDYPSLYKYIML
jgi:hypothetical protein